MPFGLDTPHLLVRSEAGGIKGPPKCGAELDLGEGIRIFSELILSVFNIEANVPPLF